MDDDQKQLVEFAYYISDAAGEDFISKIFEYHSELNQEYSRRIISYGVSENIIIPEKYFKNDETPLHIQLMYGGHPESAILYEYSSQASLYSVFRVPQHVHDFVEMKFKPGGPRHTCLAYLKYASGENGDTIFIDFRTDESAILVFKKGKLLLAQVFSYATPEDVLYYLLKICRQFSIVQEDIKVDLSGFIEKDSAIYRELYKYFLHLEFASIPEGINLAEEFRQYPPHYFSTLCKLAACAS